MSAPTRARAAAPEPLVAVLAKRGRFLVAEPLFERGRQITLAGGRRPGAAVGDIVLLGFGKRGPRVVRALGRPDRARDVLEALMLERGLRRAFPNQAEVEAATLSSERLAGEGRRDFTDLPTFTIDPVTARDYDDAISAERVGDLVRVFVHIADVSDYVRPGSALEREAFRRATSVYVPGTVEPMLPDALSSDACSLVAGERRRAVTVELELSGAEVRTARFHRSLIRSDATLTYGRVDRVFEGSERAVEPWATPLALARAAARALRERRERRGALAVESAEQVFEWDGEGNVVAVRSETQTESHSVIEQLMILANEQVAGALADARKPTLYRVHEAPDPQAVTYLADQLASLEVPTPPLPEHMAPQQASEAVGEISQLVRGHLERTGTGRRALGTLILRSLKQAYYSPRNVGHAGLGSARYCHFTSPIRRYPDLVAHRALLALVGADDVPPEPGELGDAGVHSSAAEREAMKIERDADDVCLSFLLERTLAEEGWERSFDGEIVGLVGGGAFVSFGEQAFEGFLPVRTLGSDWWELNELGTALVGERSGSRVRLGDPIAVGVRRIDAPRGRVDLVPAG